MNTIVEQHKTGVSRRGVLVMAALSTTLITLAPKPAEANVISELEVFLSKINKDRSAKGYKTLNFDKEISKVSQELSVKMSKLGKTIQDTSYVDDDRVPDNWLDSIQIVAETNYNNGGSVYYQITDSGSYSHVMDKNYDTVGLGLATSSTTKSSFLTITLFQYDEKTLPTPSKTKQTFKDVTPKTAYYEEIEALAALGIAKGYADGTYRAKASVRRDHMISFIYRAAGSPRFTPPKKSPFTDIKTNNAYYKEITWAHATGITTGYKMKNGTRKFKPKTNIRRDHMAVFLMNASKARKSAVTKRPFKDVSIKNAYSEEIQWMKKTGLSTGTSNGKYKPKSTTTRGHMAVFLTRWIELMK